MEILIWSLRLPKEREDLILGKLLFAILQAPDLESLWLAATVWNAGAPCQAGTVGAELRHKAVCFENGIGLGSWHGFSNLNAPDTSSSQ